MRLHRGWRHRRRGRCWSSRAAATTTRAGRRRRRGRRRRTKEVTIGWTPPDITGVFKTATDYFEQARPRTPRRRASTSRSSAARRRRTPTFADQLAIVEDFISRNVDVIAISPADTRGDQAGDQAGQRGRHPGHHGQPARGAGRHRDRELHRLRQRRGRDGLGLLGARLLRRPGRARRRREGRRQAGRLPRPEVVGGDLRRRRQGRDRGQGRRSSRASPARSSPRRASTASTP